MYMCIVACYQSVASASSCWSDTLCWVQVPGRTLLLHGNSCAPCCLEYGARPLSQGCLGWAVGVHSPSSRLPSGGSPMNTMYQHHCLIGVICIHLPLLASTFAVGRLRQPFLCFPGRALCFSLLAWGPESRGPPGTLMVVGSPHWLCAY